MAKGHAVVKINNEKSLSKLKLSYTKTFWGALLAFILATSCCWIPAILIGIGGASIANALVGGLNIASIVFFALGFILTFYAGYLFYTRKQKINYKIITKSKIICPDCGMSVIETMLTDSCQYFYECQNCHSILKPKHGDCCVFCSYGDVPCPPIQTNQDCC